MLCRHTQLDVQALVLEGIPTWYVVQRTQGLGFLRFYIPHLVTHHYGWSATSGDWCCYFNLVRVVTLHLQLGTACTCKKLMLWWYHLLSLESMLNHTMTTMFCYVQRTTSPWLQCLVMCKDNKIRFLNYKQLVEEHILAMLQKTMTKLVLYLSLYLCHNLCDIWFVDVSHWVWHICTNCQFH